MRAVNVSARERGWGWAVEELLLSKRPDLRNYIFGASRIDWLHLESIKRGIAIDFGSGLGQLSRLLAANFDHVISVEGVWERVEFQSIYKKQMDVSNIYLIHASILCPFLRDSCVDLAVLNGVLEWVPNWTLYEEPRSTQLRLLKQIHRVVKPQGFLYLGIENRIGVSNMLGAKDHSGFRFTSLMPRALANAYVGLRRGQIDRSFIRAGLYRTYTYTQQGYRDLLREAGFSDVRFYVAFPRYSLPMTLFPIPTCCSIQFYFDNIFQPDGLRNAIYGKIMFILAKFGLVAQLAPHYCVIARK